jgi:hypothetical protein
METSNRGFRVRALVALFVASSLVGAASPVEAADFYAIIANLTNAKKPHAQLDVSANTDAAPAGTPITFTVYGDTGVQLGQFTVPTNASGFASSASAAPPNDNLFTVSPGLPALVRIQTPSNATTSSAILRQKLKQLTILPSVLPATVAMGQTFSFTLGPVAHRATLLLANLSGNDAIVDVFVGSAGAPGTGKYTVRVRDSGLGTIELDPATDSNAHLIIVSSRDILAQLAIDEGKKNTLTEVMLIPL